MFLNFFLCHVTHGDQKCRKSAFDGIAFTLLYASKHFELHADEALCSELKDVNPRAWKTVSQRVKT